MDKHTLIRQFDRCYNENGWFAAVRNVVAEINVEQATWKPLDAVNCIWESLSYLQRFKGIGCEYDVSSNDETFSVGEFEEAAWQADIGRFAGVMKEWRDLILSADESKLSQPVSAENRATWAELISDVNAHNAYHGGQIVLLRKMQGIWDESSGVT